MSKLNKSPIGNWMEATRSRGNTSAILEAAIATSGTVIITASARATVDAPPGVCALMSADTVGRPGPVFVDVTVVQELVHLNRDLRAALAVKLEPPKSQPTTLAPTSVAVLRALANAKAYELLKPFDYSLGKVLAAWIAAGCPGGVDTPEAGSVLEAVQDLIAELKQERAPRTADRAERIVDGCPDGRPSPATPPEAT